MFFSLFPASIPKAFLRLFPKHFSTKLQLKSLLEVSPNLSGSHPKLLCLQPSIPAVVSQSLSCSWKVAARC